jgi:hypothetical protein
MEQRSSNAALRDVIKEHTREEFVLRMMQQENYAALMAVPPMPGGKKEFVPDIARGVVSTQTTTQRFNQTLSFLSSHPFNQLIVKMKMRRNVIVGF